MLDMHCHVLFNVDDGAENEDISRSMLDEAAKCGIDKIVFTPHLYDIRKDMAKVRRAYDVCKRYAADRGIKVKQGFEVNWRVLDQTTPDSIGEYRIEGTDSILLELPNTTLFPDWEQIIIRLAKRHNIIIAHPERYNYVQRDLSIVQYFIDCGCEIAVDAGGLSALFVFDEYKTANRIVAQGMVNYIVSDAHRPTDYKFVRGHKKKMASLTNGKLYDEALWK